MVKKGYRLSELADLLKIEYAGDPELVINRVNSLEEAKPGELAFLFEDKYFSKLTNTRASCLLVREKLEFTHNFALLISNQPKISLVKIMEIFAAEDFTPGISKLAEIANSAEIAENAQIGAFSFIDEKAKVGEKVIIYPGCYIGKNCQIGSGTIIYPNVTIMSGSEIGEKVIIHSGTVIGSDGYGFVQTKENRHEKVPQLGKVIIEADVEIGANVTIDRATLGATKIGKGSKIDNLVHIAHNVEIGERNLIIAQSGIAGSSKIGADSIIAGQSGIAGHLVLGEKTIVAGKR